MERNLKVEKPILISLIILMTIFTSYIFLSPAPFNFFFSDIIPTSEDEIYNDCLNLSISDTARCFNKNIILIYNPRLILTPTNMSFEELTTSGGDCNDYTDLYMRLCERTNYSCKRVYVNEQELIYHVYLTMASPDGYCSLDQTSVHCMRLLNE